MISVFGLSSEPLTSDSDVTPCRPADSIPSIPWRDHPPAAPWLPRLRTTVFLLLAVCLLGSGTPWGWSASTNALPPGAESVKPPPRVPPAFTAVLTQHNNLGRTGANLTETVLNVHNVNPRQFGLVCVRPVDDEVYAQPLVMTNVDVPGRGVHNLVIVATVNDTVYAFDADDPEVSTAYWQVRLLEPNTVAPSNRDMIGACDGNYTDFSGNIGIVGTPVIDPGAGTLYVVARFKDKSGHFVQKLHALNVATGAERKHSPVTIHPTYPGDGVGSLNNVIHFDPQRQNQRPALALTGGLVYVGWASHCDWGPYHGWLVGYDATTLQQEVVYNATPEGYSGGIWMSGQGPSADGKGNIYVSIGNGSVGTSEDRTDVINRGESVLRLVRDGGTLRVTSWFTPYNWKQLEDGDLDLGSAGVLLIPDTNLAVTGSKEGKLYVLDRTRMGGLSQAQADTNIVQTFQVTATTPPNNIHGAPIWWDGPRGSYTYVWGESDYLRQYTFDRAHGKFLVPEHARSPSKAPLGMPGGFLSISADGTQAGTGIVWASHPYTGDANHEVRPGVLRAFNAEDVSFELWNSEQVSARDSVGKFAKFCPPTVANGKVYLATFSKRLMVYGLLLPTK